MKTSRLLYPVLFLLMLPLMALSCEDEPTETDEERQTRLLSSKTWTVTDVTGSADFTFSGTTSLTFNDGGGFSISGLANLPNENVALFASGTWSFPNNNTQAITITNGTESTTLTIVSLSDTEFNFTYTAASPKPEDTFTATVTTN